MKSSTMMAIALCGVLACAVTGCKYDDESVDGDSIAQATDVGTDDGMTEGKDIASEGTDGAGLANAGADLGAINDEDGKPATGVPFDQDPNYVRCTDVDFAPVYFGFDSTVVPQGEIGKIDEVAQHLGSHADRVVVVEGNCDERGSNEYNMALGENRASIIRNYLVQSGVDASRIQTRSFGEEKPAVVGSDESAWARNRRGEFVIYQK